jgi:hypothetical protein
MKYLLSGRCDTLQQYKVSALKGMYLQLSEGILIICVIQCCSCSELPSVHVMFTFEEMVIKQNCSLVFSFVDRLLPSYTQARKMTA